MSKLPIVDARVERILLKWGFKVLRQKGSHVFYRHPNGRYTTLYQFAVQIRPIYLLPVESGRSAFSALLLRGGITVRRPADATTSSDRLVKK